MTKWHSRLWGYKLMGFQQIRKPMVTIPPPWQTWGFWHFHVDHLEFFGKPVVSNMFIVHPPHVDHLRLYRPGSPVQVPHLTVQSKFSVPIASFRLRFLVNLEERNFYHHHDKNRLQSNDDDLGKWKWKCGKILKLFGVIILFLWPSLNPKTNP